MGVIQNALNQMLGTVAIARRLSPDYERKQELKQLKKEEARVDTQGVTISGEEGPRDIETYRTLLGQKEDIASRRFAADPTEENYQSMLQARKENERSSRAAEAGEERRNIASEIRRQDALRRAAEEAEARLTQRKKHEEFISMFTEGGRYK